MAGHLAALAVHRPLSWPLTGKVGLHLHIRSEIPYSNRQVPWIGCNEPSNLSTEYFGLILLQASTPGKR
jgi:hypothetical protein